jgi:hypothetical protein
MKADVDSITLRSKVKDLSANALRQLNPFAFAQKTMDPHGCVAVETKVNFFVGDCALMVTITDGFFEFHNRIIESLPEETRNTLTQGAGRLFNIVGRHVVCCYKKRNDANLLTLEGRSNGNGLVRLLLLTSSTFILNMLTRLTQIFSGSEP